MSNTLLRRIALFATVFLLFPFLSFAQSKTVTGVVKDESGKALTGVSVVIKGSESGTSTSAAGAYSIIVPGPGAVLQFSTISFTSQEITVGNKTNINLTMRKDDKSMDAIVVVGYGTQKRKDVTGAVASVSKDRLEQLPNNNILSAIQGSVPGVLVNSNSASAEGNGQSILIRGRKSISASANPLIIWDGIPYVGGISDINPTDVESIEILKDASATAIYGTRGSNGVILVTSKKGTKGKLSVVYDGSYSTQSLVNKPNLLTGEEFYKFKTTRLNSNTNVLTSYEQKVYDSKQFVDWYDLSTRVGSRSQHSISVRGGGDKVSFYLGGTFLDVKGVVRNDNYKRYSLRPNLDINLTKWLTFSSNTQISFGDRSGVPVDFDDARSTGGGANYFTPLASPFNADGSIAIYADSSNTQARNPLSNQLVQNTDNTYKIFTTNSIKVDVPFVKGLSYRLNTGVEYENNQRKTYYGRDVAIGLEAGGDAINFSSIDRNFTVENILNYSNNFGKHSVNVTALYSSQSDDYDRDQVEGKGFPNDVLTNYQMNAATLVNASNTNFKNNLESQMGRINYGYDSRYLLTLTARRDGYSAFGKGRKYGTFPSAAIAWNVTEEKFMQAQKILTNLKLRLSYGLNGNQAVSSYTSLATLASVNYLSGTTVLPGYIPNRLSNDKLGWESTKTLNIGLDFGILKNRISGTVDYYNSNTYDLLLLRAISPIQGFTSVFQNIGRTAGHGIEFGINSTNYRTKDFLWTTNANFAYNHNEIRDLYGDGKDDAGNRWFIGQPIRVAYGLQYDGIFRSQKEVDASAQKGTASGMPGYVRIKDANGDSVISTSTDRIILGQLDPKYVYGFTNTFTYKNFNLSVFFQGIGGLIKDNPLQDDNVFSDTRRNTTKKDWWSPDNPNATHYANDANANKLGVNFYEDGSFLRLKDVSLAYNFSKSLLAKAKIASAKLYVTARNLATITSYNGLDPELSNQTGLPLQRDILFGLTLGL